MSTALPTSPHHRLSNGRLSGNTFASLFNPLQAPAAGSQSSRERTCHDLHPPKNHLVVLYQWGSTDVCRRCHCRSPIAMVVNRIVATRHGVSRNHQLLSATWRCGSCRAHVRGSVRSFHIAPVLMPPLILTGLFIGLWTWKCMMMVLMQNMIVYNPFMPPNARSMTIAEFARQYGGIKWREERIRSLDGTGLGLCVANVASSSIPKGSVPKRTVYILYFQGLSDWRISIIEDRLTRL